MAFKAVEEPRFISAIRRLRRVLIRREQIGSLERGSIRPRYLEPGSPLSRAKAHVIREAPAIIEM